MLSKEMVAAAAALPGELALRVGDTVEKEKGTGLFTLRRFARHRARLTARIPLKGDGQGADLMRGRGEGQNAATS